MFSRTGKALVEVCPQCYKSVDSSVSRIVQDACGHSKCRICLLQEVTGCLICEAYTRSTNITSTTENFNEQIQESNRVLQTAITDNVYEQIEESNKILRAETTFPVRKSVITSLASQLQEQKLTLAPESAIDADTRLLIEQSQQKDILFPTNIVKRSTGNFYHLKRILSERFFNEDKSSSQPLASNILDVNENSDINDKTKKTECVTIVDTDDEFPSDDDKSCDSMFNKKKVAIVTRRESVRITRNMQIAGKKFEPKAPDLHCSVCDKTFDTKRKCYLHKRQHNLGSKFACTECSKRFKDNNALQNHKRIHSSEKPFTCSICHRSFANKMNLNRHKKYHNRDNKLKCPHCIQTFFTSSDLRIHGAVHSNNRFLCNNCDKYFKFKKNLARHLKSHEKSSKKLTFECKECDSTFKRRDNLERHVKNVHCDPKTA